MVLKEQQREAHASIWNWNHFSGHEDDVPAVLVGSKIDVLKLKWL